MYFPKLWLSVPSSPFSSNHLILHTASPTHSHDHSLEFVTTNVYWPTKSQFLATPLLFPQTPQILLPILTLIWWPCFLFLWEKQKQKTEVCLYSLYNTAARLILLEYKSNNVIPLMRNHSFMSSHGGQHKSHTLLWPKSKVFKRYYW